VERLATLGAILKGELNEDALRKQLTTLSDEAVAKRLSETAKNLVPENGASIAAQAILDLL
jgi:UDP:flavonoid glycosyltransferase YjiC (YdhE family)